jgi:hypothetical protein
MAHELADANAGALRPVGLGYGRDAATTRRRAGLDRIRIKAKLRKRERIPARSARVGLGVRVGDRRGLRWRTNLGKVGRPAVVNQVVPN